MLYIVYCGDYGKASSQSEAPLDFLWQFFEIIKKLIFSEIFVVIYSLVCLVGPAAMYEKRGNEPFRTGETFESY